MLRAVPFRHADLNKGTVTTLHTLYRMTARPSQQLEEGELARVFFIEERNRPKVCQSSARICPHSFTLAAKFA